MTPQEAQGPAAGAAEPQAPPPLGPGPHPCVRLRTAATHTTRLTPGTRGCGVFLTPTTGSLMLWTPAGCAAVQFGTDTCHWSQRHSGAHGSGISPTTLRPPTPKLPEPHSSGLAPEASLHNRDGLECPHR